MSEEEHPSLMLADTHVIPILLYVGENGGCTRTELYLEVGCTRTELYLEVARSANTPGKLDMLVSRGLLEQTRVGNCCRLALTRTGRDVVERIREIDGLIKGSETETYDD